VNWVRTTRRGKDEEVEQRKSPEMGSGICRPEQRDIIEIQQNSGANNKIRKMT
jgi:hypothetical protein